MRLLLEFWWLWIPVGLFLLMFSVALIEKQKIRQFRAASEVDVASLSPYYVAMTAQAVKLGLKPCGFFIQDRGSAYKAYMSIWLSEDRTTMVRVGGGKIGGVAYKRTVVSTWSTDGRGLETTDEIGVSDLSGTADRKCLLNADLFELAELHVQRRAGFSGACRLFSPDSALLDYENTEFIRVGNLVAIGYARFIDREKSAWRFTIKGAFQNYWKGFRSQKAEAMSQLSRASKTRPGG